MKRMVVLLSLVPVAIAVKVRSFFAPSGRTVTLALVAAPLVMAVSATLTVPFPVPSVVAATQGPAAVDKALTTVTI